MSKETRILLDEKMFEKLVSGEVLEIGDVKIALQDIGYHRMLGIILMKMEGMKVLKTENNDNRN